MPIVYEKLLALKIPDVEHRYGAKDCMLYALGVGLGVDPVDEEQLAFVYEKNLKVLPTMAVVLGHPGFWVKELDTGIDWVKVVAGEHSLGVEAFFCRQPDENHAAFYRFLLERNGRMYGVHFSLDPVGDVYLTGKLPLSSVGEEDIDRLLGCVLSYSDENFDAALELGFGSAIRREWAWRVKRGESLANLQAFARFADPSA